MPDVINHDFCNITAFSPTPPPSLAAIVDSGASATYISIRDHDRVTDVQNVTARTSIAVRTANGTIIKPYATGSLRLLNDAHLPVHLFRDLAGSLISVGQIIDTMDARAEFDAHQMTIAKKSDGTILLRGTRCPTTKLWLAAWSTSPPFADLVCAAPQACASACAAHAVPVHTIAELVQYWHESFGCPRQSTFLDILRTGH